MSSIVPSEPCVIVSTLTGNGMYDVPPAKTLYEISEVKSPTISANLIGKSLGQALPSPSPVGLPALLVGYHSPG